MIGNYFMNIEGDAPFNPDKFPLLIGLGESFMEERVCETPEDVPLGVDFVVKGVRIEQT
tara:strand:- start:198 stop:374 length:177 start_codon:yes stop_codon:yes gene_type:complete